MRTISFFSIRRESELFLFRMSKWIVLLFVVEFTYLAHHPFYWMRVQCTRAIVVVRGNEAMKCSSKDYPNFWQWAKEVVNCIHDACSNTPKAKDKPKHCQCEMKTKMSIHFYHSSFHFCLNCKEMNDNKDVFIVFDMTRMQWGDC